MKISIFGFDWKAYHWAYLAMWLIAFRIVVVLVWGVWPYHPFVFNKPIEILTQHVVAGGVLVYSMDYCKPEEYASTQASVRHSFVDHLVYNMPAQEGPLDAGCHVIDVVLDMPKIPAGTVRLLVSREYRVNPVRKVTVTSESAPFRVWEK